MKPSLSLLIKKAQRGIATALLVTFTASSSGWSAPASLSLDIPNRAPEIHFDPFALKISVPESLGRIQSVDLPQTSAISADFPTVVMLQDAHGNLEAQQNTRALIRQMHQTYGIKLLFLEGAS